MIGLFETTLNYRSEINYCRVRDAAGYGHGI